MPLPKKVKYGIIDLFCGAGGTTLGFEAAASLSTRHKLAQVIACVNHDPLAIKSHWSNHPHVIHFEEDIRQLNPWGELRRIVDEFRQLYPDAKIILWASLECTNFSKAKGGLPRDADSRTLANHLFKYVLALDPDYVQIENVVEFMDWGPLDANGKPIKEKKGQHFKAWRRKVCKMGYHDDWKQVNAADFGALTSRNRLFGCFAKPSTPVVWPAATHAKDPAKFNNERKKWRAVREALDFQDEGLTIFNRMKRVPKIRSTKAGYQFCKLPDYDTTWLTYGPIPDPLSKMTMQRLFLGSVRHIAGGKKAYAERYNGGPIVMDESSFITKYFSGHPESKSSSLQDPLSSITTVDHNGAVFLTKFFSGKPEHKNASVNDPSPSVTTFGGGGLAKALFLTKYNGNNQERGGNSGKSINEPAPTLSTQNIPGVAFISRYNGVNGGKHDNGKKISEPIGSLATGDQLAKIQAHFIQKYYSQGGQFNSIADPAATITTKARLSKVSASFMDQQFTQGKRSQSMEEPLGAITTVPKSKIIQAFIMNTNYDNTAGHSLEQPAPTLTATRRHHYLINPSWFNEDGARSVDEPCFVLVARQDKVPLYVITCTEGAVAVPIYDTDCEWTVKLKEFMVLYNICDIKMRMLKVPELKVIQGFPVDYVLHGNQTDQKKFIGNAVVKYVPEHWIMAMEQYDVYGSEKLQIKKAA